WAKADQNGELAQDEVVEVDSGRAVFGTDCSQVVNGFYQTSDGKTYYQDISTIYRIALGYHMAGEHLYYFDSITGVLFVPDKEGWLVKDGKEYYFLSNGEIVRPPVIDSVTVTEVNTSTSNVTINASFPGSPCAGYSFDGGKTWQTSNTKSFERGTVIAAGTLMVKDTTGGKGYIVSYDQQVEIPKVVLNGVYGIDVSKHQGEIDWNKVAASGVSFAIIRAVGCYENSRTSYIDPYFETNVRNAKAAGLNVGVYIYSLAKSTDEMVAQVNFFLNSAEMKRLNASGIKFDYPVYIDYENTLVCEGTTYAERTNIVRTGMVVLDQNGYYPGFYTYHSFMSQFDVKGLVNEGYDFWYARYPMVPNPDVNPSTTYNLGFEVGMWQYCSDGNTNPDMKPYVDGIRTAVDLNRVYKDYPTLVHNKNGGGGTIPDPVDPVQIITVYDQVSKRNVTDSIENLLPQIVQNEVGGFNNAEVWKAQAVAAHSWLLYQMSISDNPPTVGLRTPTQAIKNACAEVKDKIVTYNGTVANTLYGASNSTKTNSALNMWGTAVPYLIEGVDSPGDANATHSTASQGTVKSQGFTSTIGLAQMKTNIEKIYPGSTNGRTDYENWLTNPMRSSTGYVTSITVMGNVTTGGKFYDNCWGLFSPNFTMRYNGDGTWTFTTYGNGHGVGMSQWGAYGYAQQGRSWEWILLHYYPGTKVESY
ncbi:SpoIID/LytB domain-containing protein, partial [uncultured Ruthenibacterium sp.]|uniref:SpoIID/LytB domain-containing protein n=1 Tax=uncultured Ruthenibacterium sp. TaxID=1905347 RepID=UPI00349E681F